MYRNKKYHNNKTIKMKIKIKVKDNFHQIYQMYKSNKLIALIT